MKNFLKSFLKKFLKILVGILVLFVAYYIFCLIRANLLVGDLAKAMEYNNLNGIEDLTGEKFFGDHSIDDFYREYISGYEHVESYNKNFSYNKLGMKPYYYYILFEYEISYPDPLWLLENSKDAQEIINNFPEEQLTILRKANFISNYLGGAWVGYSKFLLLGEDVQDFWGNHHDAILSEISVPNLENIMNVVNQKIETEQGIKFKKTKAVLAYNIFTNKFETDGIFYYAARGFLTPQEIVSKFWIMQINDSTNEEYSGMSLSDGSNEIYCTFYKDDLIWIENDSGENEEIEKQNIYFIQNNIKKNEILEVLAGSGYEEIEEVNFHGASTIEYVEFGKDICLSPENLKGLSREEVIERLKKEGFYLGEWEFFEKGDAQISVFFYENELIWLKDGKDLETDKETNKETENLVTYIIENDLKENEVIEFLLNEGYVRVEE